MTLAGSCLQCRSALQPGAKFCVVCGQGTKQGSSEVERRQLTILFCGLVGATGLAERLDLEDFCDLLASYQGVCRDSVGRHGGHVSQLLGDGVMAYFGYPMAQEDDAARAIHAAMGILEGAKLVNGGIGKRLGTEIRVRAGIHTGTTVVGELGPGGAHDRLAVGETVNLAARIQSTADDDTAVISASTAKLVRGYFDLQSLGQQTLKGFTSSVELFRVLRPTDARTNLDAATRRGLTPHVGREAESEVLADVWKEVREGADRVVVVRGEAGIGKSRIVHHFRHTVLNAPALVVDCYCSPLARATAFAPLVELLDRRITERVPRSATPEAKVQALRTMLGEHSRFDADALPLIAALLSLPGVDDASISDWSPVRRRARTLETLREWVASLAERLPLALLVEDVHWADPSTLDFLDLLARERPGGRTLVCVTARPEFVARWSGPHVRTIEMARLSGDEIAAMVSHVTAGRALPPLLVRRIAERSEGVPLFVEEVTKGVLESGALRIEGDRYQLAGAFDERSIPATVHASLLARFDRLGESKGVAQLGAAIGREFSYLVMQAVTGFSDHNLREHLDRLCRTELAFVQGQLPNAVYVFKHALIQDAIYGTLLKSERSRVHERIFRTLQEKFPELIAARPEMAAYHAENAGQRDLAVPLLRDAGLSALGRMAVAEGAKHLGHAIELVDALEEPARTSIEIELQAVVGPVYMATIGWSSPEVERASTRLRDLAAARGDGPKLLQAMWGLWTVHFLRGRLDAALGASREFLEIASQAGDPMLRVAGHHAVGYTHFYRGEYANALFHADEGLALFDLETERRIASVFQLSSSCAMWCFRAQSQQMIGLADKAAESLRSWEALVDELRHPPSRAMLLCQKCRYFHMLDDVERVEENARETRSLSVAEGFAMWVPIADMFLAWASVRRGESAVAAVDRIKRSQTVLHGNLTYLGELEFTSLLAQTLLLSGEPAEVFRVAEAALAITRPSRQDDYEPEVYRLQGEAANALGDRDRAIAFCREGIASARSRGAKALELRSAIALARMIGAEHAELRSILDGFTEGRDQPDVKAALSLVSPS
jgi:class 3 adenylate cyclase/tetratricopeptide (TPR) repeat protein